MLLFYNLNYKRALQFFSRHNSAADRKSLKESGQFKVDRTRRFYGDGSTKKQEWE